MEVHWQIAYEEGIFLVFEIGVLEIELNSP